MRMFWKSLPKVLFLFLLLFSLVYLYNRYSGTGKSRPFEYSDIADKNLSAGSASTQEIPITLCEESNFCDTTTSEEPARRFFEGPYYYEEARDGVKDATLLVIEGLVSDINVVEGAVTIERDSQSARLNYISADSIYLLTLAQTDSPLEQVLMEFSEIRVGDFLSYSPAISNSDASSWFIQR